MIRALTEPLGKVPDNLPFFPLMGHLPETVQPEIYGANVGKRPRLVRILANHMFSDDTFDWRELLLYFRDAHSCQGAVGN